MIGGMFLVKILYIEADGTERPADIASGLTLMEGARDAPVRGIAAECGGACACSTGHVYIVPSWFDKLPAVNAHERDMLEFAWEPDPTRSRLTCQIRASEHLEGLIVHVPRQQI